MFRSVLANGCRWGNRRWALGVGRWADTDYRFRFH